MENARLYAIAIAFFLVAGVAALVRQQMNTTDLLTDLRNAKAAHEAAQEQLVGFRESVTTKRAELAALKEKLGGRVTSLAELEKRKVELEELKSRIEKLKAERVDQENEMRQVIRTVRTQIIGKELPPQKIASGAVLTRAKIQRIEDDFVVLSHEMGVSKLAVKELPPELAEKLRFGDPLLPKAKTADKAVAAMSASSASSAQSSTPQPAPAPNQRRMADVQDEINKVRVQVAQYEESATGWRNLAQSYRAKASGGKINSWGVEAAKADGEVAKAEGMIRQLNYRLTELQRKMDDASMGR